MKKAEAFEKELHKLCQKYNIRLEIDVINNIAGVCGATLDYITIIKDEDNETYHRHGIIKKGKYNGTGWTIEV